MEKINKQTPDLTSKNIAKITELFPNVITEKEDENGRIVKAVDFDLLRQELSKDIVEGGDERYRLDWPGKRRSMLKANTPINKTLKPDRDSSVNFNTTENVYIEGDNFEVLKILQESYLGKIKMIYIDPPYNTGKDFVYKDDFKKTKEEYEEDLGVEDEEGGRLFKNTNTNGRFHSDWLSMMYERLVIARDLLKDDGVIFISIDDNEVHNLSKICDEVFGESNFLSKLIIITGASQNGDDVKFQKNKEYCLVYAKNEESFIPNKIDKADESLRNLNDSPSGLESRPDMGYSIYFHPETKDIIPLKDYNKENIYTNDFNKIYKDDDILIKKGYVPIRPGEKDGILWRWRWGFDTCLDRIKELVVEYKNKKYYVSFKQTGYLPCKDVLNFNVGTSEVKSLFDGNKVFDYPKSKKFLSRLVQISCNKNDIILDFFAGSSTTAHSVIDVNLDDGGNRKFIMVQYPEDLNEALKKSTNESKKTIQNAIDFLDSINKPRLLTEVGKERIRRAGKKIVEENADKLKERETPLDIGFRAYKVADSIMQDVYKSPNDLKQGDLLGLADNIREDKKPEDILTSVILDLGLTLDLSIKEEKVGKNTIFNVDDGSLVACFDKNIDFSVIDEIAKTKPLKVVFRDASFKDDKDRINVETRFKQLSPDTNIKVI